MDLLRVSLFGGMRVMQGNTRYEVKLSPAVQTLFAYLLISERSMHSREVLTELFWSDQSQDKARGCLNTALWRLRRAIEPEGIPCGTYLITTRQGEVGFNRESDYWLDVSAFKNQVSTTIARPIQEIQDAEIDQLVESIHLYHGELLEGMYDDWALREREHVRMIFISGLAYLMRYFRFHKAYDRSLDYGLKILDLDPLREEIHRDLMRMYNENGQRALAVYQYEQCCKILQKELGIEPMLETQRLYQRILQERKIILPQEPNEDRADETMGQALSSLREAVSAFNQVQENLDRAIQLMEQAARRQDQG